MTVRAAIIGAGPSGFYAADLLLRSGFDVDLFDVLPTPFGLVRSGVAPDHPKIKSVTRVFSKTAEHDSFRFFGGVELGRHISRRDLLDRYHAVIYAVGTARDTRLGIPGEDRPGSYAATDFVAWYNGHPHHSDREFGLGCSRAVVIGNGNVAVDVARMLLLSPDELQQTDTADHALKSLSDARVREVILLGRRGPAEAAFTNPELRELGELEDAELLVRAAQLTGVPEPEDPTKRRNLELLRDYAQRQPSGAARRLELRFLRSPLEIIGIGTDGAVTGVRVGINRLVSGPGGSFSAEPTGEEELIECGLVLRSIGYRGAPIDDIPFDSARGLITNEGGRVVRDGQVCPGEYAVGWIKRGPSGVIGTNKKDATDTVTKLLEDADAGRLLAPDPQLGDADSIGEWLAACAPKTVFWDGWEHIDQHEISAGTSSGRPRVKLVRLSDLHATAAGGVRSD